MFGRKFLRPLFFDIRMRYKFSKYIFTLGLLGMICICSAQTNNLNFYVSRALISSPLLKDYQNQIQSNLIDSQRIRATYKPQVNGASVNSYAPIINGFGYDYAITNGGQVSALVMVNKTLVGKNNLNTQFASIQINNQSISNSSVISEQDLRRTITSQYIIAYGDFEQFNFNKEVNRLLHEEEIILKRLTQNNVYRQTDYLAFLVTLQQQELALKQIRLQFLNDFATLNYMAGINDTNAVELEDPHITLTQTPDFYHSIFFRKFELDSVKLTNEKALVGFSYKPKVNLFADGGFNSSFAYKGYKNFGTSFGVSLSVPIYDGKQKQMQYSKISIAEKTRSYYQEFFAKQYDQQLAQLNQQLQATEELLDQINSQIKYAETLTQANTKLLQTGEAKIADYIIALNTYLNARNLLTQNKINRLQIINQINYWSK